MNEWVWLVLILLSSGITGNFLFRLFLNDEQSQLMLFPSIACGLAVNSIILFWTYLLELPMWVFYLYSILPILLALIFFRSFFKGLNIRLFTLEVKTMSLLSVILGISLLLFLLITLLQPYGGWDAFAFWNLKGRLIAMDIMMWDENICNALIRQKDYPLMLPLTYAMVFPKSGVDSWWWPAIAGLIFTAATVLMFLRIAGKEAYKVIFTISALALCYGFIELGAAQYADIPLSFFLLCGIYFTHRGLKSQNPRYYSAAGFLLAATTWIKNEGLIYYMIILLLISITVLLKKDQYKFRNIIKFLIGGAPFLLTLIFFKSLTGFENEILKNASADDLSILDPDRWYMVVKNMSREFIYFSRGPMHPLILGLLFFLGWKTGFIQKAPTHALLNISACFLILIIVGFLVLYMLTPLSPDAHIQASFSRLLLQVYPVFVFYLAVSFDFKKG